MTGRFKVLLFIMVAAELISLLAIVGIALLAPQWAAIALNVFGALLALRAALVVVGAVRWGEIFAHPDPVLRNALPRKFWLRATLNVLGIIVGVFLMQVQHIEVPL